MSERIEDRIGYYLVPHLDEYVFDELSDAYLERAGIADIMSGVPVPINKKKMMKLSTVDIARSMAFVIGCDPNFDYKDNYVAYIKRMFGDEFVKALIADGVDGATKRDYDYACIQFRAAMLIDPGNVDAMYCYGRACKDAYELADDEDFVSRFKAEALDAFEQVTLRSPEFAEAYYFLGYGYLNLGLYIKAQLTWQEYMKLTEERASEDAIAELRKDVQMRLDSLEEPVKVEQGYNLVLSGRFEEGIEALLPYREGPYKDWWPLWYYIGMAYSQLEMDEEAVSHLRQVLQLSPSNLEAMEELVVVYGRMGNDEMVSKYEKKIEVVKHNMELDKAEKAAADAQAQFAAQDAARKAAAAEPGLKN